MIITLKTDITVAAICEGFVYNELEGKGLFGLSGKLTIQPEYQRNYIYADGKKAPNWISVGATGPDDTTGLPAYFSNYGKKTVDVFAPGLDIPSCVLGSKYDLSSGTSTAAPVVSGMAAVLKSYFPHLKAIELRQIIMESVYLPKTIHVRLPGNKNRIAPFKEMSVSGGIVNLYRAVQLALDKYCR